MRVSTQDQNLNLQEDELKKAGCDKIFSDKISGSLSKAERPGLKEALEYLREGDELVVYKLDRLGRSLKDLVNTINDLNERKINFSCITQSLNTSNSSGKLIFHVFAAIAEFEKELIRERTISGLESARARGRKGGRPSIVTPEKIAMAKQLHANRDFKISRILKTLGVSKAVFYRMLKQS